MWKTKSLKDLCSIFTDGDWIEKKDQSVDGIRLVQTGNIKVGYFAERQDKARYISEDTFNRLNCTEVKRGDILVSRLPDPVGRASIIPELKDKAITAVDCTIIRLKEEILPTYLNYYMQSPQYLSSIQLKVTGATRQRISRKNLGEISITFPPLPEQERIVAKLDAAYAEIDKAIEDSEKSLANATYLFEQQRNSRYELAKDLYPSYKVSDIAELSRGHNPPKSKFIYEPKNGYVRFYQIRDAKTDKHATYVPDSEKLKRVKPHDFLMNAYRHIGEVFKGADGAFNVALCKLSIKDVAVVDSNYLYYMIPSSLIKGELLKTSARSLIPSMSVKELGELSVPIPSLQEQQKFVAELISIKEYSSQITAIYEQKLSQLNALKSAILSQELQSSEAA
jgi:type I restriction enzyme S subunit